MTPSNYQSKPVSFPSSSKFPEREPIIFTYEELEYLEDHLEGSNEYWRSASTFVHEYLEGGTKVRLSDKQYAWLLKIKSFLQEKA